MAETPGNFLNVDSFVCKERGMAMAKVMDPNSLQTGDGGILLVTVTDTTVPKGSSSAADPPIVRKAVSVRYIAFFVFCQDFYQRLW